MEVQPVVEHEPADEWVEGKSHPADEMGKEYNPFMGLGGRNGLPRAWEPVRNVCGQVSGFPELLNVLLRNGAGHPLASRSGHAWNDFAEKEKAWALELERGEMDEQRRTKAWVEKG